MKDGIPTTHPRLRKLWRVSRILGNISPFNEELLRHNEAQLDFIMEMYAEDHEEEYEFVRPSKPKPLAMHERLAAMENVLLGPSRDDLLKAVMPSQAVLERARKLHEAHAMMASAAKK